MCRIGRRRCCAVAKVPEVAFASAGVVECYCRWVAAGARVVEFSHREVGGQVEAEHGVVAVVAVVVHAVGACGHRKLVASAAAGAYRLVQSSKAVKAACATVNVVAAMVVSSRGVMLLPEMGGIHQVVGVHVYAHKVEILAVGGALVGVAGDGHVGCATCVPGIIGAVPSQSQEYSSPSAEVQSVANVHGKGCRRYARLSAAVAKHGAPHQRVEVGLEAHQKLSAVGGAVVGVSYQRGAAGFGLAEEEYVAAFAATHEIALVVSVGAVIGAGHERFAVIGYLGNKAVGAAAVVVASVGVGEGGEVEAVGAAGDNEYNVVVAVDTVNSVVLYAS